MLGSIEDKFITIILDNEIIVSRINGACKTPVSEFSSFVAGISAALTSNKIIVLDDQSLKPFFLLLCADDVGYL
jgi:hypothetical protein